MEVFINKNNEKLNCFLSPFSEVSYDDANNVSIVTSDEYVINFDDVSKNFFNEKYHQKKAYKSIDSLFWSDNTFTNMVLVEFKNGKYTCNDIRLKIYDTIITICNYLNKDIDFCRQHISIIIVSNNSKDNIQNTIQKLAGKSIPSRLSPVKMLENIIVNSVEVLSPMDFIRRYNIPTM